MLKPLSIVRYAEAVLIFYGGDDHTAGSRYTDCYFNDLWAQNGRVGKAGIVSNGFNCLWALGAQELF